ncbi:MAG: hypothetical protein JNK04_07575 [Myxococcales bacterium]|nr:hypothetical protein [Myxococcales bacterium]
MRFRLLAAFVLLLSMALWSPVRAWAGESPPASGTSLTRMQARVKKDGVLVVHVLVPLCDNAQIVCGSKAAGDPVDLARNLYWGAVFGQKRFFTRKASSFTEVSVAKGAGSHLERAVVRRFVEGAPWGREGKVELVVVLDAFRGDRIDSVVDAFFNEAAGGASVAFEDGGKQRKLAVTVVGYAGHNRMMDGKKPPALGEPGDAIPSFVMACHSRSWFERALHQRGSDMLIMTKQLMAPEGYVVEAIVGAVGENAGTATIKRRAIAAYAKWQKIEERVAATIFD